MGWRTKGVPEMVTVKVGRVETLSQSTVLSPDWPGMYLQTYKNKYKN